MDSQPADLEAKLLKLAGGGDRDAYYDGELEDVCVPLSATTQLLVDYPRLGPELLRAIASGADPKDFGNASRTPPTGSSTKPTSGSRCSTRAAACVR
jgi:hypothetical protein